MRCRNCARAFEGNFCPNCGTPAASGASASYGQTQNQQYQPNPTVIINNTNTNTNAFGYIPISPRRRWVALVLCLLVGVLGVHRFYVGKVGTGILYLFTAGLFGIGVMVDAIMILCGSFRDCYGGYLKR